MKKSSGTVSYKGWILSFMTAGLLLLLFSWSTSPLYLTYGCDSPFFQIIGLGITQGKIPYVDLFDHKGPVPFFMNALGYSLGLGRSGLFIVQVLWMTVTLKLMYMTVSLFVSNSRQRFSAMALTMLPLIDFITEGNQVEEWQLPFIALTLFLLCRYMLSGQPHHPVWQSMVYGLCFGMVFYNRPNDGVMWIGALFFGLLLRWIVRKYYREIAGNIIAFIGGFVIITVPILTYFAVHDAVDDMIFGMIVHNIRYAGGALFTWGGIGMILIPALFIAVTLVLERKEGNNDFGYVLIPVLVFVVILIGKRDYYHYLIPFIPFIAICMALCLKHSWKKFLWTVCILFAIFSYRELTFMSKAFSLRPTLKELYSQTDSLFDCVPEEYRNQIWNYNLDVLHEGDSPRVMSLMSVFLHKGITPSSPVLAAYDIESLSDRFDFSLYKPEWLIMNPDDWYNKDFDYIYRNYVLVAAMPAGAECGLRIYKRKDYGEH